MGPLLRTICLLTHESSCTVYILYRPRASFIWKIGIFSIALTAWVRLSVMGWIYLCIYVCSSQLLVFKKLTSLCDELGTMS